MILSKIPSKKELAEIKKLSLRKSIKTKRALTWVDKHDRICHLKRGSKSHKHCAGDYFFKSIEGRDVIINMQIIINNRKYFKY